jgi:hypothetical protein
LEGWQPPKKVLIPAGYYFWQIRGKSGNYCRPLLVGRGLKFIISARALYTGGILENGN